MNDPLSPGNAGWMPDFEDPEPTQQKERQSPLDAATRYAPFKPPFRYETFGTQILDSRGQRIVDVRGWGYLTGKGGGLGLDEDQAEKIQDRIGEQVAAALNDSCGHNDQGI